MGWFNVNIMSTCIGLSVFVEQFLKFGELERKVVTENESLMILTKWTIPVIYDWYNAPYFYYSFMLILEQNLLLKYEQRN